MPAHDGVVEALERTDGSPGLFISWHPEFMGDQYPKHTQAIYGFLVKACLKTRPCAFSGLFGPKNSDVRLFVFP